MAKFPSDPGPSTIAIMPDVRPRDRSKPSVLGDDVYVDAVYTGLVGTAAVATYRRFLRELAAAPDGSNSPSKSSPSASVCPAGRWARPSSASSIFTS